MNKANGRFRPVRSLFPAHTDSSAVPASHERQQRQDQRNNSFSGVPATNVVNQMLQVCATPDRQHEGNEAQNQVGAL
jgi:hypothetical protein